MAEPTPTPVKIHSQDVTEGPRRAGARAMLRAVGLRDEDFAKPQIGVASTWNEVTPCNMPLAAGTACEGRRAGGRRLPVRVRRHRRLRRDIDGARRDAGLACEPRGDHRLSRDRDARRALRRVRGHGGLRQVVAGHDDGGRPPRPAHGLRLRRLHTAGAPWRSRPRRRVGVRGRRGVRRRRVLGGGARRHRAERLSGRGRLCGHVHGQHDGVDLRGDRVGAAGQRLGAGGRPTSR